MFARGQLSLCRDLAQPARPYPTLNPGLHSCTVGVRSRSNTRLSLLAVKIIAIDKDPEYEDPMANITYPDVDRLTFWGMPYQFDYVFGPGTEQAQVQWSQPSQSYTNVFLGMHCLELV